MQISTDNIKIIRYRLKVAPSRWKSYVEDKRKQELKFAIRDFIFLKVFAVKGFMRFGKKWKLSPRYIGPFDITQCVRDRNAYMLELSPQLVGVHNIFHVSMLRKYKPNPSHILYPQPLEIQSDMSYEEKPITILYIQEKAL